MGIGADSCTCLCAEEDEELSEHDVAKRGPLQKSPSLLPPAQVIPDHLDLSSGVPAKAWAREGHCLTAGL